MKCKKKISNEIEISVRLFSVGKLLRKCAWEKYSQRLIVAFVNNLFESGLSLPLRNAVVRSVPYLEINHPGMCSVGNP